MAAGGIGDGMWLGGGALADGLAFGPPPALAVLGCALALGSGNRRLCALLAAAVLVAAVVDFAWLCFGPLGLSAADLASLAEGQLPERWEALERALMAPAFVLLLQAPLKLGVAVGALYRSCLVT